VLFCAVEGNKAHGKGFAVHFHPCARQRYVCRPDFCRAIFAVYCYTAKALPCTFKALPCTHSYTAKNQFPVVGAERRRSTVGTGTHT
jgi:hypothetical protein